MIIVATFLVLVAVCWYFHDTPWKRCQKLVGWNYGFNKKVTPERLKRGPFETDCSGLVAYVLGMSYRLGSWQMMEGAETALTLDASMFRDKSLIAYCSELEDFNADRPNGINHIMVVLEHDNELYLCDSKIEFGVRVRPLVPALKELNEYAMSCGFGEHIYGTHGFIKKQFFYKK